MCISHGKKVYRYLPKFIKATVTEIVAVLSNEPAIERLYKEWNKVNREKFPLYYENKEPTVPLVDNKEFRCGGSGKTEQGAGRSCPGYGNVLNK